MPSGALAHDVADASSSGAYSENMPWRKYSKPSIFSGLIRLRGFRALTPRIREVGLSKRDNSAIHTRISSSGARRYRSPPFLKYRYTHSKHVTASWPAHNLRQKLCSKVRNVPNWHAEARQLQYCRILCFEISLGNTVRQSTYPPEKTS